MKMKELYKKEGFITAPGCYDPLSALALQKIGFKATYIGGWAVGAHLGVTEPLTTMTEFADIIRRIHHVADIPIAADMGAGFGLITNMKRSVREFEDAGAEIVHLEDQVVPKRIGYHKGNQEYISVDEMLLKIEAAKSARRSDDFMIIARTDAGRKKGEPFQNMIDRLNIYKTGGPDMLMGFPHNEEEMLALPKAVDYPLCYVASEGLGGDAASGSRPCPTPEEAKSYGYSMIIYPLTPVLASYSKLIQVYQRMYDTGKSGMDPAETSRLSKEIMSLISIDQLADLEINADKLK